MESEIIKSIKKLLVVTVVAILLCSMAVVTASATTDVKDEKKNTGVTIESKEKKVSSYKVTWNYNGGKIGSKKSKVTTVKRGSKIGKLPATPKKSEYTIKGWYTKKSGGKKITKNTKVTKKVTFFAQWKTTPRVLNSAEKKLVGDWSLAWDGSMSKYRFNKDGTYFWLSRNGYYGMNGAYYHQNYRGFKGYYSVKNGKLTTKYQYATHYSLNSLDPVNWNTAVWSDWETGSGQTLKFYTDDGKQYVDIGSLRFVKN